jgi:hypothetical protein
MNSGARWGRTANERCGMQVTFRKKKPKVRVRQEEAG